MLGTVKNWTSLNNTIQSCEQCSRLRKHCLKIAQEKRKAFETERYWGKPVIGFGDVNAELIIIGLAPAAHGANRTGRVFTGDRSGLWLYRALYKAGFASQPDSVSLNDGLKLSNAFITATVKCAPPDNKPTRQEITRCLSYLKLELSYLNRSKVYLALGKLAFDQIWGLLKKRNLASGPRPKFEHGKSIKLNSGLWLAASYHPSQQNTFTGKLTEEMFDHVFSTCKSLLLANK